MATVALVNKKLKFLKKLKKKWEGVMQNLVIHVRKKKKLKSKTIQSPRSVFNINMIGL